MIYLDNAATSLHKPPQVVDAVMDALQHAGNAGRGATEGSLDAARILQGCRKKLAELFNCPAEDHVCFAPNATAALNTAINGLVNEGDHVVTTVMEHNSALRPLNRLAQERGVQLEHAGADANGALDYGDLAAKITPQTKLVLATHASNVTGNANDLARIAELAHAAGAVFVADASQTAGCMEIDMQKLGIDVLCFTGHKGLMGPQGTGGLAVMPGIELRPYSVGGTGVHSFDELQPSDWPTRLEAGTQNAHGIAGLSAAIDFINHKYGPDAIGRHERAHMWYFYEEVRHIPGITLYGDFKQEKRAAIIALNVGNMDSAEVSDQLSQVWGIATRPGAHCAPLMHKALGTEKQGVVRFSFGYFNTRDEVDVVIDALKELAN